MDEIRGMVYQIRRFCLNAGPGLRVSVMLKGCPMHCAWCPRPEAAEYKPQLVYKAELCDNCEECAVCRQKVHLFNPGHTLERSLCIGCGRCVSLCPENALELVGRRMTVGEVLDQVEKDQPYFGSLGGMTLTGGEPLYQPGFTLGLLREAQKRGIHTCLCTNGHTPTSSIESLIQFTDVIIFSYLATGDKAYRDLTGMPWRPIWDVLTRLDAAGKALILRCPIVPGLNDSPAHEEGIAQLASTLNNLLSVELTSPRESCPPERPGLNAQALPPSNPEELQAMALRLQEKIQLPVTVIQEEE